MYSEKIDNICGQLIPIKDELISLARTIISDIYAVNPDNPEHSIDVSYYTENYINNYNFFGMDDLGYSVALNIDHIDEDDDITYFVLSDEDGDNVDGRCIGEFNVCELILVVCMLNDILTIAKRDGKVVTMPTGDEFDEDE